LKIGDPKTGGPHGPLIARRKALREEMDALREEQSKGKSSRGKLLDQIKATNDSVQRKVSNCWNFLVFSNVAPFAHSSAKLLGNMGMSHHLTHFFFASDG
jgi:hypothetical protein